jgi:hypothetical protein
VDGNQTSKLASGLKNEFHQLGIVSEKQNVPQQSPNRFRSAHRLNAVLQAFLKQKQCAEGGGLVFANACQLSGTSR